MDYHSLSKSANTAERVNMIKQCGNCYYWDIEDAMNSQNFVNRKIAECKFPVPISVPKTMTYGDQGQDCPLHVYEERQSATEEDDDDQPDENGYTRADEDWFFDDKDD